MLIKRRCRYFGDDTKTSLFVPVRGHSPPEPASPWFWAALEPHSMGRTPPPPGPSLDAQGQPHLLGLSTPDPAGRHWEGPAQPQALGERWEMSPAPSRRHKEQTVDLHFWCCSRAELSPHGPHPSHGKRVLMAGGVFCHPHGRQLHHWGRLAL